MRTRFLALGAATVAALTFAACGGGGGGSSTTPQTVTSPAASSGTAPNPILQVINTTGPTTQVSVTLKLPQRTGTSAAVHAAIRTQFGSRLTNKHIRTMMNTAPTAQMRALGQQQNVYAQAVQKRSGRAPQFISGSTSWVELVMTDTNNTVLSDDAVPCSVVSQQCTATFTVPVGNLTATLLLYDTCPFLLGAGSASVNVLPANNPALNITVNGVVSSFEVTPTPATSPAPPVMSADGSQHQAIGVTVAPLDADDNVIGSPGALITSDFLPITNVTLNASSPNNGNAPTTLSNTTGTVTPDATNVFSSATFPFTGLGNDVALIWTASPNVGSTPVVPLSSVFEVNGPPNCCGAQAPTPNPMGSQQLAIIPGLAFVTGVANNIVNAGINDQPLTSVQSGVFASWMTEFPQAVAQTAFIGVVSNIAGYSGNINIADIGNCAADGIATIPAFGGNDTYTNILAQSGLSVQIGGPFQPINDCALTATDDFGNVATLNVLVSSTSLTISNKAKTQNKARKH